MIVGDISARKNSTRLPHKMLLPFNNTTLFEHSLLHTKHSQKLDKIVVISDDERIWEICDRYNIEWIAEPEDLANQNNAHLVTEFVMDFMQLQDDDILLYLPPTAPLRTPSDIDAAIELFLNNSCNSVVSVRKCRDPPEWAFTLGKQMGYIKFREFLWTSQNRTDYYCLNGAIYISRVGFLRENRGYFGHKTIPYIMPYERSIDIDEREDYELALYYFKKREEKYKNVK